MNSLQCGLHVPSRRKGEDQLLSVVFNISGSSAAPVGDLQSHQNNKNEGGLLTQCHVHCGKPIKNLAIVNPMDY